MVLVGFHDHCEFCSGIPVFVYHGLTTQDEVDVLPRERKYWIAEGQFRDQLNRIRDLGYRVVSLHEGWSHKELVASKRPVVTLTFDDGLISSYEVASPLLNEAGMTADFFVNTATIGQKGFLSWDQIARMRRAGMSFQSHSHDHVDLTRLSVPVLARQLRESKHLLEERLGCAVDFLAVPHGLLSRRVLEVAEQQGYLAVCNSRSWPAQPGARAVNRIAVHRDTTLRLFTDLLEQRATPYLIRMTRSALVHVPKRVLLRFHPALLGVRVLEHQA